jgi:hypothetical protein
MTTNQKKYQPLIEFFSTNEADFVAELQNLLDFVSILATFQTEYLKEFAISNSLHNVILLGNAIKECNSAQYSVDRTKI